MTINLANASSQYGAAMGRTQCHNLDIIRANVQLTFEMVRLAWVDGDYDSGGAYWGHTTGEWIYRAQCEEYEIELWERAKSDADAQAKILADYPGAQFVMLPAEDVPVADNEQTYWASTGSGRIELQLTRDDVERMAHQGQCDADVAELRELPRIAKQLAGINADALRQELREYGAWDAAELADHDANLDRILFLLAWDVKESDEYRAENTE